SPVPSAPSTTFTSGGSRSSGRVKGAPARAPPTPRRRTFADVHSAETALRDPDVDRDLHHHVRHRPARARRPDPPLHIRLSRDERGHRGPSAPVWTRAAP